MFTEFQTHFLKRKLMFVTHEHWFSVALGIPQTTEYLRKTLSEGTSTFRNVLEFIYRFPDDSERSPSILSGSPPFSE